MFPRGIRLSNPGNIRKGDIKWLGMSVLQDDPSFIRFLAPKYGIRALMKILTNYDIDYGINTVSRIVTRWAPPGENNTDAYIRDVANRSGYPPNVILDMASVDTLIRLSQAIVMHENGSPPNTLPDYWYEEVVYHDAAMMVVDGP